MSVATQTSSMLSYPADKSLLRPRLNGQESSQYSLPSAQAKSGRPLETFNAQSMGNFPIAGPSRSAPTSPISRPNLASGLQPLSSISAINLSNPVATSSNSTRSIPFPNSLGLPQSSNQQQQSPYRQQPSQPLASHANTTNTRITSTTPNNRSTQRHTLSRSASRTRARITSSSSDDTDSTEIDSDSTFVPGRVKHQRTHSQPDLTAYRSKLVGGWADGVMRTQLEDKRKEGIGNGIGIGNGRTQSSNLGRKTPPSRHTPLALSNGGTFSSSGQPHSKSQPSLVSLRPSISPRQSTNAIPLFLV